MSINIEKDNGNIKISDEVIVSLVYTAVTKVDGVAEMSGGIPDSISNIISKNSLSKGIKVSSNEQEIIIDIYITVNYGVKIPEVAWNIQESVKKEIENATGISVNAINIHVQGVVLNKKVE